jgi:uncharacterized membrane protein (DUF4010 family)
VLVLTGIAAAIGVIGAYVGLALVRLIGCFTNSSTFTGSMPRSPRPPETGSAGRCRSRSWAA